MSGFNNPIIGGGGALVYPDIHSPDFVVSVSGWSINKDGSAHFSGLTILDPVTGDTITFTTGQIQLTNPGASLSAPGLLAYLLSQPEPAIELVSPQGAAAIIPASLILMPGTTAGPGTGLLPLIVVKGNVVATNPVSGGAETWHALGGIAGMTGPSMYRLTPENELQIEIRMISTSGTAAGTYTFPNTLPAAYLPQGTILEPAVDNASVTLSTTIRPRFFLSTAGASQLILSEALTAGQLVQCRCKIPLDI